MITLQPSNKNRPSEYHLDNIQLLFTNMLPKSNGNYVSSLALAANAHRMSFSVFQN